MAVSSRASIEAHTGGPVGSGHGCGRACGCVRADTGAYGRAQAGERPLRYFYHLAETHAREHSPGSIAADHDGPGAGWNVHAPAGPFRSGPPRLWVTATGIFGWRQVIANSSSKSKRAKTARVKSAPRLLPIRDDDLRADDSTKARRRLDVA